MPPFVPFKHLASTPPHSPRAGPAPKRAKLTDALDAEPRVASSLQAIRDFSLGGDDSDSSLSSIGSDEFEDMPSAMKDPTMQAQQHDDDDDIEWEDAIEESATLRTGPPMPAGDLVLTFSKDDQE